MTRILEEAGIPVIHDTTLNDYPSYNGSYDRTRENIERYLEQYPPYKWSSTCTGMQWNCWKEDRWPLPPPSMESPQPR